MRGTLILVGLLLTAGLVAAPGAAAIPHPCDASPAANNTCWLAADTVADTLGYASCYQSTSPKFWVSQCL